MTHWRAAAVLISNLTVLPKPVVINLIVPDLCIEKYQYLYCREHSVLGKESVVARNKAL